MKKFKKVLLVVLAFIFLLNLASCKNNKYNAEVFSKVNNSIKEEVLADNKISIDGEDLPNNKLFIISNSTEYSEIFKDELITCDFEKSIIYVYVYRSVYANNKIKLSSVMILDNNLYINYKDKDGNMFVGTACQPYARWIAVKMDKTDTKTVKFEKV